MCSIIIENNTNEEIEENIISIIKKCIDASSINESCPYSFEVSVTITNNDEIRKINSEFRNIDKPTDVLSFPMIEYNSPSNFDSIDEEDDDLFNLDTGELVLGDIIISYDKAKEQANEYGHSLEREIGFLTVHSMLHLFGYDHINDIEEDIMKIKQEDILKKVGLSRWKTEI